MNKLLVDVHVPHAIVEALRKQGVDVRTAQEEGLARASDEELLAHSSRTQRILVTQDADFLAITSAWQLSGSEFSAVLFARQGVAYAKLISDIELILTCCDGVELKSQVYYLPLA